MKSVRVPVSCTVHISSIVFQAAGLLPCLKDIIFVQNKDNCSIRVSLKHVSRGKIEIKKSQDKGLSGQTWCKVA